MILGALKQQATALGFDTSTLPPVPSRYLDITASPAVPGEVKITLTALDADEALTAAARRIPGVVWVGAVRRWDITALQATLPALRALVVQHSVKVSPTAAAALKALGASTTTTKDLGTVDVDPKTGRLTIALRVPSRALEDALLRISGTRKGDAPGVWHAPASQTRTVADYAAKHHLDLTPRLVNALKAMDANLRYDQTLNGLAGVPLKDLYCMDEKKIERFKEYGIRNVLDLLMHIPLRYLDRSALTYIRDLREGEETSVLAKVTAIDVDNHRRMVKITLSDGTGTLRVTYFNAVWQAKRFRVGDEVVAYGKIDVWVGNARRVMQLANPMMDPVGDNTLPVIPIYPQSVKARITTWEIHTAVSEALRRLGELTDPLPAECREQLLDRADALRQVHLPSSPARAEEARTRLAYDELFRMQTALLLTKNAESSEQGIAHTPTGALTGELLGSLPFPLTGAQSRAIAEISDDLRSPHPTHRLLQGDVGSGKAQPLHSKVLTPDGFITMGAVRPGTRVCTPDGGTSEVLQVFPQGVRPVYRIKFDDGTYVDADDDHLWAVVRVKPGRFQKSGEVLRTTAQLRADLRDKKYQFKWAVPRAKAVDFPTVDDLPIPDPYVLGALIGGSALVSVPESLDHLGTEVGRRYTQLLAEYGAPAVERGLKELDLLGTTIHSAFVPDEYKHASTGVRHAVLQGLMDTLGQIPDREGFHVTLRVPEEPLARDIQWLVHSLGGNSGVSRGAYKVARKDGDEFFIDYQHVNVALPEEFSVFREPSKVLASRHICVTPGNRVIRGIKYVGAMPTQCILIDSDKHQYVTDNFTPTHNTLVAINTLLTGVESGYQGALMAPTEILATQLYNELVERTEPLRLPDGSPLMVEFFSNKLRGKARDAALARLSTGATNIAVGTHALLVDDVKFKALGVVVVDEQHRFGVEQRAVLRDKGPVTPEGNRVRPDTLVMTATPIPRTQALTAFGDLEWTVLDELPPGRTPIKTTWVDEAVDLLDPSADPWGDVRAQVAAGRQAYVVCPLVEGSEKLEAASATETFEALQHGALAGLRIGLVHGQQKTDERSEIMAAFRDGDLDVLVATTVIEVGVNVPNASIIVILDPARFGIAQLHQLRGRVGRGKHASYCVLAGRCVTTDSRTRMEALCASTDGFYLSEVDLGLRGHGQVFGSNQSGLSDLRVADLARDKDLLEAARATALALLDGDPLLARRPALRAEILLLLGPDAVAWLTKS